MTNRIEAHCHLLPGRDDGCQSVEESIACARRLVEQGYNRAFCTPHIWPNYPNNTVANIPSWVDSLQKAFDRAQVPLKLMPGGELNLHKSLMDTPADQVVTYGMKRHHALIDIWCHELPDYFDPTIRWLQNMGLQVILAHPERMHAVTQNPDLLDHFADLGLLLQGNLYIFVEPEGDPKRIIAEKCLTEGRYFMLGSDTHRPDGMDARIAGLHQAQELVGPEQIRILLEDHPAMLIG